MAYSRPIAPRAHLQGGALTQAMVGLGMRFSGRATRTANIEDVLLFASEAGMEADDLRTLDVLTTWIGVHGDWINVDRLTRLVQDHPSRRVRAYWASIGHWRATDARFRRLRAMAMGADAERERLLRVGNDFQVERRGEDPCFESAPLIVPAGVFRHRAADVAPPSALARNHHVYRERIVQGPSYRADMWALLKERPELTASELARWAYGSYATAVRVKREWKLVVEAA